MTRTDAIIAAIKAALEDNRDTLDGPNPVRAVRLIVRMSGDRQVSGVLFTPEIESVTKLARLDRFAFEDATQ